MYGIFGAISFNNPFNEDSYSKFVSLADLVYYRRPDAKKYLSIELGFIDKKLFINYFNTYLNGNKTINYSDISRVFITEKWLRNLLGERN